MVKVGILYIVLPRATPTPEGVVSRQLSSLYCLSTQLELKWSDCKKAPKTMYRGAAVVHGTIAYVIRCGSRTIYSYQLHGDKWNKHSKCPHVNPGLVVINDLLTTVGGEEEDHPTNKLISWNCNNWVETFPPMQTPREEPAVLHYGDYIIALGGDLEERGVELLHIPSLLWSTVISLPRPIADITATLCHDKVIAMDCDGYGYVMNIKSLIQSNLDESSTEHSQWMPLPQCPVNYATWGGPSLTTLHEQSLVVSYNGIFQLIDGHWVRIGNMSVPMEYCIVCVVCDQMVVVGGLTYGYSPPTDAVRVTVIV